MRSTASGKNIYRSTISSNHNITSINKMGTFQTISNDVKFTPSEELILFSNLDECTHYNHIDWDPEKRRKRSSSYEGDIKAGKKWGIGSYWYENGDFYYGNWENDKPHGEGIFYFAEKEDPERPVAYTGTF